jgi:GH15 family glucan-1,4-alpha-glucosidase
LKGFRNSAPVRVGNAAFDQFQLDIYGSLIDSYYFMWRRGGLKLSGKAKNILVALVGYIEDVWQEKDEGIWEMRSGRQHYTYSKVMSWVGVNRALRMSGQLGISGEKKKKWSRLERTIKKWIWDNCYNEKIGSFTQHPETDCQDATNFLFVLLQFLDRHDNKTRDMIIKTCRELSYKKSFIYRYLVDDSLKGKEGTFVLCTFWMIASLAAVEESDEAMENYYDFRKYIDQSMLMSEEIDPDSGEYLGNFPQAFSHMGLILAAYFIDRYKKTGKKINL